MPIIGWEPSRLTADMLLALSFVSALFGLSLMAYAAIPDALALRILPVRSFLSRNRNVLLVWLLAVLVLAFVTSQSITIYRLASDVAQRQAEEWPALTAQQQKEWITTLAKYSPIMIHGSTHFPPSIAIIYPDPREEKLVESLRVVFKALEWPKPLLERPQTNDVPDGISIAVDPQLADAVGNLMDGYLGYKAQRVPYPYSLTDAGRTVVNGVSVYSVYIQILIGRRVR